MTLLALACAAVGIVTYLVLSRTLQAQLDSQLRSSGGSYAGCIEAATKRFNPAASPPPGIPPNCNSIPGLATGTFGARLKNGVVTSQGIVNGKSDLSAADKAELTRLPPDGGYHSRELASLQGDYRLTAVRGRDGDVLITGLQLKYMESTLGKVEIAELIVFSVVLLLTGVIGTGFVRLSLRPLRRVAATATQVTGLPLGSGDVALHERVSDVNPRTEVGQVGAAFNRMLGHVEASLARRAASEARLRRFAADASHELRTPLAAIRGYAELARRHPGRVPADVEHALKRVESESARMSLLVDELLLLAQLDAGRPLVMEPVDLTRLAIDAASDAQVAAPSHRWLLDLPGEPVLVRGDEHRLHQVLANLMSNAARHTPPGTTVEVTLITARDSAAQNKTERDGTVRDGTARDGTVQLSVTDDGPGIPAALQATLFERFVRLTAHGPRRAAVPAWAWPLWRPSPPRTAAA